MDLLVFILACYGMTMILVYSKIFEKIREKIRSLDVELLSYMIKCTMCMGFWVGIFNSFLIDLSFNWFIAGCVSSGTSYFISRLVDDDGILIKVKSGKEH
jgi:hypothetical protein